MTHADSLLDNIDHALHDWDTSPDARRWTPERPKPPGFATGGQVSWAPLGTSLSDTTAWRPIGHCLSGMRLVSDDESLRESYETAESYRRAMRSVTLSFQVQGDAFRALIDAIKSISPLWRDWLEQQANVRRSAMHSEYHRRQKRRKR